MDRVHSSSTPAVIVDMSPLLGQEPRRGMGRLQGILRGGRMMRDSSMLVRETAAEQLEERQSDWAYSRPVVVLDLVWNLAFVMVALLVLVISREEQPCGAPLRIWVLGYALQCLLHMSCVVSEYQRRRRLRRRAQQSGELDDDEQLENVSLAKRLESANTMFSFIWWVVGFYWITSGSEALVQTSPRVYWLCIVFLAFDVFFVVFCVALACMIGIAVCCCLPCIIAILYAVVDQEGASEEDINMLPKLKFRRAGVGVATKLDCDNKAAAVVEGGGAGAGAGVEVGGGSIICSSDPPASPRLLSPEDAECCICLCSYEDGVELRELPCSHHFHGSCIVKWLQINATCPLCKYNIIHRCPSNSGRGGEEEV